MLSWADLEAIKQNSGHHPVEKNEVNHHYKIVHPVVVDTPTETLTFRNKQLALHRFFRIQAVIRQNVSGGWCSKKIFVLT